MKLLYKRAFVMIFVAIMIILFITVCQAAISTVAAMI